MSLIFCVTHSGPASQPTVNITVPNTSCKQLTDDVVDWNCLNSYHMWHQILAVVQPYAGSGAGLLETPEEAWTQVQIVVLSALGLCLWEQLGSSSGGQCCLYQTCKRRIWCIFQNLGMRSLPLSFPATFLCCWYQLSKKNQHNCYLDTVSL